MKIISNANKVARLYRQRIQRLEAAVIAGLKRVTGLVNAAAQENLGGSDTAASGSWPVPNRTGTLFRGQGEKVQGKTGYVFNTTAYAQAIHSGNMKTREGLAYSVRAREFLDKAVEAVDAVQQFAVPLRKAIFS